jgi:HSP20 family protein
MQKDKKKKKWESQKIDEKEQTTTVPTPSKESSWKKKNGELAVDVYETEDFIVIQAPIAGVKKEELEIITEKDVIIIKGERKRPEGREIKGFYTQECFFGEFRREVILPEETDPSRIDAKMKEGILIIEAPKIEREKRRKIDI